MLYFTRYLFPVCSLWHLAGANALDGKRELHTAFPERQLPRLTAVTVRSDIQKRGEGFIPKQEYEHHYADSRLVECTIESSLTDFQVCPFLVGTSRDLPLPLWNTNYPHWYLKILKWTLGKFNAPGLLSLLNLPIKKYWRLQGNPGMISQNSWSFLHTLAVTKMGSEHHIC